MVLASVRISKPGPVLLTSAAGLTVAYVVWQLVADGKLSLGALSADEKAARKAFLRLLRPLSAQAEAALGYERRFIESVAALESDWGRSRFAQEGRNYFGMRKGSTWTGAVVYRDPAARKEPFRAYRTVLEGIMDHAELIARRWPSRYGEAYAYAQAGNPGYFEALERAGYALNADGTPERSYGDKLGVRYAQILELEAAL